MKAIGITPGKKDSAQVKEVPEPPPGDGSILVQALELGICGTDFELIAGEYGAAQPGEDQLILGHESLGEVLEAPESSGFAKGDLVAGIVRRPDPVPCVACARGEWDMCRNGLYTERGIKERNGFGSERWRIEPQYAIKVESKLRQVGVLTEPTSVVSKAWDQIERIGARSIWSPKTLLVTGAGPIGLLSALLGRQRGLEVHVLDRMAQGPKVELVKALGGTYHTSEVKDVGLRADILIECTGVPAVVRQSMSQLAGDGILCLLGVSPPHGAAQPMDMACINREMVLDNTLMFGSVNSNRRHWEMATQALAKADIGWLSKLITRKVPLEQWRRALERQPDDIKVVIDFSA